MYGTNRTGIVCSDRTQMSAPVIRSLFFVRFHSCSIAARQSGSTTSRLAG